MPHIRVWIHFVWSTKNREPFLSREIRNKVFGHIKENAKSKDIYVDFIGGYVDHVHCLISLDGGQKISEIIQLLKGESSFWINKNKHVTGKFGWQEEYFAVSVSESNVESVRRYIANQEKHHGTESFEDEYDGFLKRAGFDGRE